MPPSSLRPWHAERPDRLAPARAGTCFVYFVQAEGGGPIKVGMSRSPSDRLRQLQTSHAERLRMARVVAVHESKAARMERNLHRHFADARLRGEWFRPVPELVKLARAAPVDG